MTQQTKSATESYTLYILSYKQNSPDTLLQVAAKGALASTAFREYGNSWTIFLVCAEVGRIMFSPPFLLHSIFSTSLLFPFFHKSNVVSCAVQRYNFSSMTSKSKRRDSERKSSGHSHSGKFIPHPPNLTEN